MRFLPDLWPHKKTILCYVWIDGSGQNVRAKSRTACDPPTDLSQLPNWNYDGSSTGQASGHVSDVILKPVAMFNDPLRGQPHKIVMCDTYDTNDAPLPSNTRFPCNQVMKMVAQDHPWFGMEQEYALFDKKHGVPLGWPCDKNQSPGPQGPYYCGVGANKVAGRAIVEDHYKACLSAGITISGENAEVMLGQWEFQVGPCEGMAMGDELWIARFLLHRIAEAHDVIVSLDPKPIPGDWNGAGMHTNVSTKQTRAPQGVSVIGEITKRLEKCHDVSMQKYDPTGGEDNKRRLTGKHETSSYHRFTSGVADRGASVRIPLSGYFEDRRPASNADPYSVCEALIRSMYNMWPKPTEQHTHDDKHWCFREHHDPDNSSSKRSKSKRSKRN